MQDGEKYLAVKYYSALSAKLWGEKAPSQTQSSSLLSVLTGTLI